MATKKEPTGNFYYAYEREDGQWGVRRCEDWLDVDEDDSAVVKYAADAKRIARDMTAEYDEYQTER